MLLANAFGLTVIPSPACAGSPIIIVISIPLKAGEKSPANLSKNGRSFAAAVDDGKSVSNCNPHDLRKLPLV